MADTWITVSVTEVLDEFGSNVQKLNRSVLLVAVVLD